MIKEQEKMEKVEESNLHRFEKTQKIKRINNITEYNRNKIADEIQAKQERLDEFQIQKNIILEEAKKKRRKIDVEKSYIISVYDKVMRQDLNVLQFKLIF